jgi:holo-[acyl-carrier protein] synthase
MIYGVGQDIVNIKRIDSILGIYGEKFKDKILSSVEIKLLDQHNSNISPFIAKRFAAKEAFAKACGLGIRNPINMKEISVINDILGKPQLKFSQEIQEWLDKQQVKSCYLSLSDEIINNEIRLASAIVILEV